jgi:predicted SprT family Zn-dependent metalloprotease
MSTDNISIEFVKYKFNEFCVTHNVSNCTLTFDKAKTRAGITYENEDKTHEVSVSTVYLETATQKDVENLLLHELAHVLAGVGEGHNEKWKTIAKRIGCDGKRMCFFKPKSFKYTLKCNYGCAIGRHRRLKKTFICRKHKCIMKQHI